MKLYYHRCRRPNFGDDINLWFWRLLFGVDFNDNPSEVFSGIGTILNDKLPKANTVHIFGSGAGYGTNVPLCKKYWKVHCVRGPLTAEKIGVPRSLAAADPAILLPILFPLCEKKSIEYAFMPHIDIDSPTYQNAIESMGLTYLSPAEETKALLTKIVRTRRLITSAMHGAIIADAYRVPWFPVVTSPKILSFKWLDWASTLNLSYAPKILPPLWPTEQKTFTVDLKQSWKLSLIKKRIKSILERKRFYLSDEKLLENRQLELQEIAERFKRRHL